MLNEFSIELAQELLDSNETFPVDFDKAWPWLGFSTKGNAKASLLNCGFTEGEDYIISFLNDHKLDGWRNPNPEQVIYLTNEALKTWGMMAGTTQGKEIRKYFLECERIAKQKLPVVIANGYSGRELLNIAVDLAKQLGTTARLPEAVCAQLGYKAAIRYMPELEPILIDTKQALISSAVIEQPYYSATELGKMLVPPKSAIAINKLLVINGLQIKNPNKISKTEPDYIPTERGKAYAQFNLNTGHDKDNTTYQQLRWKQEVLNNI